MRRTDLSTWRTVLAPATAALLLVASAVSTAVATGSSSPSYRADATPATVAAGTVAEVSIKLKQLGSHTYELGSAKITPPSGFDLVSATSTRGTVTVSSGSAIIDTVDLDEPGDYAVVTLRTTVPCGVSGSGTWTVVARRNYSYSSGGSAQIQAPDSDLTTQVAKCSLAFATQPASAEVDTVISSEVANPAGTPVRVQLRDGNGDPATRSGVGVSLSIEGGTGTSGASLAGTVTDSTNGNGVATFAPRIDQAGHDYRLSASATTSGISAADDSSRFDISDVAVVCSGSCSGSSQQGDTGATVNASSNGGVLTFSIGVDNVDCNNSANKFYEGTSAALTFDVTGGTGRTQVVLKLDRSAVTKPFLKYDVCFSSPNSSFRNKFGKSIAAGEAGLLPFCFNPLRSRDDPCVILKWIDRDRNVLVKFSVPAGIPRQDLSRG